jgi:endoplasmic reticulum junction formation protein lunapark
MFLELVFFLRKNTFVQQTKNETHFSYHRLLIYISRIFVLKRFVGWYFQRRVNKNSNQLIDLRKEKKKIIEKVMEKETYKVALEILNRFEDKTFVKPFSQSAHTTPIKSQHVPNSMALTPKQVPRSASVRPFSQQNQLVQRINNNNNNPAAAMRTPINQSMQQLPSTPVPFNSSQLQLQRYAVQNKRTPYPIINQNDKTVLEKMVDYLIGDGPNNRFAMICKECHGHNGERINFRYKWQNNFFL